MSDEGMPTWRGSAIPLQVAYVEWTLVSHVDEERGTECPVEPMHVELWYRPLPPGAPYPTGPLAGDLPDPNDRTRMVPAAILKMRVRTAGSRAWYVDSMNHDGRRVANLHGVELCESAEEAQIALKASWRAVTGFTPKAGHPAEADMSREDYMKKWNEVWPRFRTWRRGLVKALATACDVTEDTIRNWHRKYGYPILPPAE